MTKTSVSIVLYENPTTDIFSCIQSLEKTNIETIYIVDNSPTEDLKKICSKYLSVNYIHNPTNPGYGAGHNIAIEKSIQSGFDYHLVINADIYFETDIIKDIAQYLNDNPTIGALMPKVIYPSGKHQELCKFIPTPFDLFARRFFPKPLREMNERKFKMMNYDRSQILWVPYLSGCFMFLRNKALKDVGLFDERFFMYPEDIDLSRRMACLYDTIYFPSVTVVHKHEQASRKSYRMLIIHAWNMIKYFNKWGWFLDNNRTLINSRVKIKNKKWRMHE